VDPHVVRTIVASNRRVASSEARASSAAACSATSVLSSVSAIHRCSVTSRAIRADETPEVRQRQTLTH